MAFTKKLLVAGAVVAGAVGAMAIYNKLTNL